MRLGCAGAVTLAVMTPSGSDSGPEQTGSGDVHLTAAGIETLQSMLDTLDIAPHRWIDRTVVSGVHIQHHLDGSGSADLWLQLTDPPEVIEVLQHQFAAGHIHRIDPDHFTDPN